MMAAVKRVSAIGERKERGQGCFVPRLQFRSRAGQPVSCEWLLGGLLFPEEFELIGRGGAPR
jgi:hypothetical protein